MSVGDAIVAIVRAVRALGTARGHVLGPSVRDGSFSFSMECKLCDRWAVIDLPPGRGDGGAGQPEVSGAVLATCQGTPYGPVVAQYERIDNGSGLDVLPGGDWDDPDRRKAARRKQARSG